MEFFSQGGGDYGQGASGASAGTEEAEEEGDDTPAVDEAEEGPSKEGDIGGRRPGKGPKVA